VLFVIAGLPVGGAERQLVLLLRNLNRDMFEVGLLIFNTAEKIRYPEVFDRNPWFRALGLQGNSPMRLAWPLVRGIGRAVRDFDADVVHTFLNVANHAVRASRVFLSWRAPVVSSVRADFRTAYAMHERVLERLLWRQSRHIICNSSATRVSLMDALGIPPTHATAIPNGIDSSFFDVTDTPLPPTWPDAKRVAIVVGRLQWPKNHAALVRALSLLDKKRLLGDWHFIFLGEGPLEHEIREAIAEAALVDRISMIQPVKDPRACYRAAQLMILPSLSEGLPNAALEAQAASCPVAITRSANGAGVVSDHDGWILEPDLAAGLATVLALPASVLKAAGARASARMREKYSVVRMVEDTAAVLQSAAGRSEERVG
jgi:glycosyltransferase involved in cell wall biosynthesis